MINNQKTIDELNYRFQKATKGMRGNQKGSQLYKWQVDYAYMIDEIGRGPSYIVPKIVDNANSLISTIIKSRKEAAESAVA